MGFFHNDTCPFAYKSAKGDGFCHDELNKEKCHYDAGDCCKPTVFNNVCNECKCYAANSENQLYVTRPSIEISCPLELTLLMGDQYCNDEANIPQCNYDGGDCCGSTDFTFCTDCTCSSPKHAGELRGKNVNFSMKFLCVIILWSLFYFESCAKV